MPGSRSDLDVSVMAYFGAAPLSWPNASSRIDSTRPARLWGDATVKYHVV